MHALPDDKKKLMRAEYRAIQEKYEKLATVKDVVDHIDHVVQVIGVDYVGIGTDFDGGGGVEGCRTCCRNEEYNHRAACSVAIPKADIAKDMGWQYYEGTERS
ncbi:MAG: dipeptidase [Sphingobacterium sp.]|nr:dipeptidase [Sphingobacterium sp.]